MISTPPTNRAPKTRAGKRTRALRRIEAVKVHKVKVLAKRRAKNALARASRKANR